MMKSQGACAQQKCRTALWGNLCHSQTAALPAVGIEMRTIAEVASITGCTYRALRFYEMKGLIRPHRTGNSPKATVRRYTDSDVERIRLITVWRSAGLSLTDIKAALVYVDAKDSTAADNLIANRLSQIRQRIIDQLAAIDRLCNENAAGTKATTRGYKPSLRG